MIEQAKIEGVIEDGDDVAIDEIVAQANNQPDKPQELVNYKFLVQK